MECSRSEIRSSLRRGALAKIIAAWVVCMGLWGCAGDTGASSLKPGSKAEIEAYFESCDRGRRVSVIEAQLGLPEPRETEAPVSGWPHWKFKYFVNNLVVAFHADEAPDDHKGFVYAGQPMVWKVKDYWREVRMKTPSE